MKTETPREASRVDRAFVTQRQTRISILDKFTNCDKESSVAVLCVYIDE